MSYEVFRPREAVFAADAPRDERAAFITRTYLHLLGAVIAFILIETVLLASPLSGAMMQVLAASKYSWLVVLGLFMGVSFLANYWAQSDASPGLQYAGLGLFVVAEALVFMPLLYIAASIGGAMVIPTAAAATGVMFLGMTAIVFLTRKNFSFLGPFLGIAGMVAMGVIVCSILFGFNLGILFTILMIGFACAYILFDTSNVLHTYRTDQHVAAALALFASVALLFWYILRLFMSRE